MIDFVENRKQLKIFVSLAAKKVVADFAEEFDMKEHGVASRIYRWFGTLPKPVQKWITGLSDGTEGDALAWFAKEITNQKRQPYPSIPPAADANQAPGEPEQTQGESPKENGKNRRGGRSK